MYREPDWDGKLQTQKSTGEIALEIERMEGARAGEEIPGDHPSNILQLQAVGPNSGVARPSRNVGERMGNAKKLGILKHFKVQIQFELKLMKRHWPWPIIVVFALWVHALMSNTVFYIYNKKEVYKHDALYDLGFALIPKHTSDVNEMILAFAGVFWGVTTCAAPLIEWIEPCLVGWQRQYAVHRLRRFVAIYATGTLLRVITFLVTVLPGPAPWCQDVTNDGGGEYDPNRAPTSAKDIFQSVNVQKGCGDLIFSGHTLLFMSFVLSVTKYCRLRWAKLIIWLLLIPFLYLTIAAHKHYTVDLVVALYTVPLLFATFELIMKDVDDIDRAAINQVELKLQGPQAAQDLEAHHANDSPTQNVRFGGRGHE
eukprot:jgi/Mesvir1/7394/Mv19195-RA.1